MKSFSLAILALSVVWTLVAKAAPPQTAVIAATPLREMEDRGFDHFYNLEYDQAIAVFQQLRDAEPDNPAFLNHLTDAYFNKQLFSAGLLQGDLFTSSNRFFRLKTIPRDAALESSFQQANQAAMRLCEQSLDKNGKDQDALYNCGVAYAMLAAFQGLIERYKLETLTSARRARDYHVRLVRLDPHRYDAYLIPGLYNFILGSLPGSFKFLLFLGGFSGDKVRGMEAVENAAKWGNRAKQDARIILAVMYRREKRYADAQRILSELAQAFPRNYIFPLEIASVHRSDGEEKEAIRIYEQILNDIRRGKPGYATAPLARIHYELGDLYWKAGDLEAAKSHLELVRGALGSNPELEQEETSMQNKIEESLRQRQSEPRP